MSDDIDEIWALYADDGSQSLDSVETALAALRKDATDNESVASLFRALHTFKGNSRLLGLSVIESCAHVAEDLVGLVRDEGASIDAALLDLLLEASDKLREMMERTIVTRRDAEGAHCSHIAERMRAKLERMKAQLASAGGPVTDAKPSSKHEEVEEEVYETGCVFAPPTERLADDPVYMAIFVEMANDALSSIRSVLARPGGDDRDRPLTLGPVVRQLRDAAARIGLDDWVLIAEDLTCCLESRESLEEAVTRVEAYLITKEGPAEPAPTSAQPSTKVAPEVGASAFLAEIEPHLAGLCRAFAQGGAFDNAEIQRASGAIQRAAARLGYIRVADVAAQLPAAASDMNKCNRLMFSLHDDLTLIASLDVAIETTSSAAKDGLATLASFLVARIPAVISLLASRLAGPAETIAWDEIVDLLDRVYRACKLKGLETAGEVSIVLTDLAARVSSGEIPPDLSLLSVLKSFVEAADGVIASNGAQTPGATTVMAELLAKTGEVTAALSNKSSIETIELQLGLPENFRGVLSAESAEAAEAALSCGKLFYIVRADIERHPELAAAFLEWTSASGSPVGSVTVFEQDATLFDFLIASPLSRSDFQSGLRGLDPDGRALKLTQTLSPVDKETPADPSCDVPADESSRPVADTAASSVNMLESIGEIATGHAAVRQLLGRCGEPDMLGMIDSAVAAAGGNWSKARESVRRELENWRENIEQSIQIESQLDNRLRQLQEDAVAVRMRPAATLLKELVEYGEEITSQNSDTRFSIFNEEELVDIDILEQLTDPMRALLDAFAAFLDSRAENGGTAPCIEVRLSLARHVNRVVATLESRGAGLAARAIDRMEPDLAPIRRALGHAGGQLAAIASGAGGVRFDVSLPLSIAALAGMVVRVGDISYVIPIHSIQRIVHSCRGEMISVSADHCSTFLKFGSNEVAPIRFLCDSASQRARLFAPGNAAEESKHLFVVVGDSGQCVALSVDELIGEQLVVIRPMKGYLSKVKHAMGCALLTNGGVGMVLDLAQIAC